MKITNKNRAVLLAVAGGYILYLAYGLLKNLLAGDQGMPVWVFVAAIVLFTVSGIAILVFAFKLYRSKEKEENEEPAENKEDSGLRKE